MRLLLFTTHTGTQAPRIGAQVNDEIVDLTEAAKLKPAMVLRTGIVAPTRRAT